MAGLSQFHIALAVSAVTLAACEEGASPTQPESSGDFAPAAELSALVSNTWTLKAPIPGFATAGRTDAGVVPNSAGQSIVYVLGGTDGEGVTGFPIQAYNVATNTWTTKASRVFVFNSNGMGNVGGKLYFSGGYDLSGGSRSAVKSLLVYDPATDRLTVRRGLPLATAEGITGVIDGKLYILPGFCSGEFFPGTGYCEVQEIRKLWRYNPATNVIANMAPCPHFHRGGAGGVIGGKFYVVGGQQPNGSSASFLDVYDPATNSWKTLAPLPATTPAPLPAGSTGAFVGATLQGQLFVISGINTFAYNPVTNTWKTKASTTWTHQAVANVKLAGKPHLLAVGGRHGSGFGTTSDSELYTP